MTMTVTLRDPEQCPNGHADFRVVDSRKRKGFRRRVHRCSVCGARWVAFLSIIDPRGITLKLRQPST